jgi:hypothetical protein
MFVSFNDINCACNKGRTNLILMKFGTGQFYICGYNLATIMTLFQDLPVSTELTSSCTNAQLV